MADPRPYKRTLSREVKHGWRPRVTRMRFESELEKRFRAALREGVGASRAGLFLVLAVSFATAPLYQQALMNTPQSVMPLLTLIELWLLAPLTATAAVMSARGGSPVATRAVQSAAILATVATVLLLRYLALTTEMVYPAQMIGVALIAAAFFGFFDWHRIAPLTVFSVALAMALELRLNLEAPMLEIYSLLFLAVVTLFGSFNQELMTRRNWWNNDRLRATRASLRRSEARFHAFLDRTPALAWIKDDQRRYMFVNQAYRDRYGDPTAEEDTAATPNLGWTDRDRLDADKDRYVLSHGKSLVDEISSVGRDGRAMDLWVHKFRLQDDEGRNYVAAVALDVTERKALERELRISDARYQAFLDHNESLSWMKDRDGRYIYISAPYRAYLGIEDESWRGKTDFDLLPRDFAEKCRAGELRVLETQQPLETLGPGTSADGRKNHWKLTRFLFRDDDGAEFIGGIATDVSRLYQAERAAQAAAETKSAFLANMSHEIRTPMNAIMGMTHALQESELAPRQAEWADIIHSSSEHLLSLINDVLDFSKIEAGRVELEAQPFSLLECVESAFDFVAPGAAHNGVEAGFVIAQQVPDQLQGDPNRLRQVLLNLLSNAVKFSPRGGQVLLEAGGTRHDRVFELHISISDQGIGLSAAQAEKLFQPFTQADVSTTRNYGGTGLGLSISKHLVELMQGRIWVESNPGQGAVFHFSARMAMGESRRTTGEDAARKVLSGRRALVLGNEGVSRRTLSHHLERCAMQVRALGSAAEARALIDRGETFDVAVIDAQAGGDSARAQAAGLREHASAAALPIVMVGTECDAALTASLNKPVRTRRLLTAIADLLDERDTGSPTAQSELPDDLGTTHPLRILVAEDNKVNQQVARLLLKRLGYGADFVKDGAEAVTAVERRIYDVILMDVQMPNVDGLSASREICSRWPASDRPRIIGMTANAMVEDREAAVAAGMSDYIAKPVKPQALIAALRRSGRRAVPEDGHLPL